MNSQTITFRIPENLLKILDNRAETDYPQRNGKPPNRSQVILEALEIHLNPESKQATLEERIKNLEEKFRQLEDRETTINSLTSKNSQEESLTEPPMTHSQLAKILGVSRTTVNRWGLGQRQPPENLEWKFDADLKLWVKNP
jgi:DNA-binding transcriptional regulator YiaG